MKLLLLCGQYGAWLIATALIGGCVTAPERVITSNLAGNYTLDPAHTSVTWSLSHAGLSSYTARFNSVSGSLEFNADTPEQSRLDIQIDPASVSTGLPKFDETIAFDSKYFDAKRYPEIRFVTTQSQATSDSAGQVTGNLTFRGQTHPVTLDVTFNGAGKSFGHPGDTLGFSAIGELSRSEFGLTYLSNLGIGDLVTLRIEAEFNESRQ